MRLTWLTDLHLDVADARAFDRLAAACRDESPDALFVTGDTADGVRAFTYLKRLQQEVGVPLFYVLGNHDFYGSSIHVVREQARMERPSIYWLRESAFSLTDKVAVVGVDGWGDGRVGNPERSRVELWDWVKISDLAAVNVSPFVLREKLKALGAEEAAVLRDVLWKISPRRETVYVLTHVPPFPGACWSGRRARQSAELSDSEWLPWFCGVSTGEVLAEAAETFPGTQFEVLCGHTHGVGQYIHADNLRVRTGGWPPGVVQYGNPVVQATFTI